MTIKAGIRGGDGAGRGDDPHGVTPRPRVPKGDLSQGYVGTVKGFGPDHQVWASSEATGGGLTDTLFPKYINQGDSADEMIGKRFAFIPKGPRDNPHYHEARPYRPDEHGHLPGAPVE